MKKLIIKCNQGLKSSNKTHKREPNENNTVEFIEKKEKYFPPEI